MVTEALPATAPAFPPSPPAAAVTAPKSRIRRVLNWFWRGSQLKALRRDRAFETARGRELAERAKVTFELARRAGHPSEPLPGSGTAAAAELFRQACYWAVRAVAVDRGAPTDEGHTPWVSLEPELAERARGQNADLTPLIDLVEQGSFRDAWELNKEQQALRVTELSSAARALLDALAWRQAKRDALWLQRLVRIGGLLVLVAAVVFTVRWFSDRAEQSRDIAVGKSWRVSSSGASSCTSPTQQCTESPDFFFHTNEERNPWVEIDLGAPTQFSAVRVENRHDCCSDRALPLVIEVSNDQVNFRELSRRTAGFSSWLASFAPTKARYVRVRAARRTMLHLAQVRVLR